MVKGIDDNATRLALMMAGIDPDSFGDVTAVDESDWSDSVPAAISRFGAEAPDGLDFIRRIIQQEHGGNPFPTSHRFVALVDMEEVWKRELRQSLEQSAMSLTAHVIHPSEKGEVDDEAFLGADAGEIAEAILHGEDIRARMLAAIASARFAPADGELSSAVGRGAVEKSVHNLIGILLNFDENPSLRIAAAYALVTLMSSSLRYTFDYVKIETASAALLMIASNEEHPARLREAAISGLGILSETWIWRIPVALQMGDLLTGIVIAEKEASFRMAAIRAYGMAFANTFIDDPGPMLRELRAILANKEVSALKQTARLLIDAIRSSDPQLVDDADSGDDGSSSPAGGGASSPPQGTPPPSTPPAGGQGAIGMMSGASLFMPQLGATAASLSFLKGFCSLR